MAVNLAAETGIGAGQVTTSTPLGQKRRLESVADWSRHVPWDWTRALCVCVCVRSLWVGVTYRAEGTSRVFGQ